MEIEYRLSYTASEINTKLGEIENKANVSDIPTKTSELTNDSGYITKVPVSSVNGKTGVIELGASDVGALPDTTVIPKEYTHPTTHPVSMITGLSTVAISGKYNDLSDKPDIPTVPTALKNPSALTVSGTTYDGSSTVDITDIINSLIDEKLGVIENGSY